MELIDTILQRRSIRKYSGDPIPEEKIHAILSAALMAPSSRNFKSAEFIPITGKDSLRRLAQAKAGGNMLETASHAIVVIGDSARSDAWIEDGSIAMTQMMLTATDLGVASCWIHCRNRNSLVDGVSSEDYVKDLLEIPDKYSVFAILALGIAREPAAPHRLEEADTSRIHWDKF